MLSHISNVANGDPLTICMQTKELFESLGSGRGPHGSSWGQTGSERVFWQYSIQTTMTKPIAEHLSAHMLHVAMLDATHICCATRDA